MTKAQLDRLAHEHAGPNAHNLEWYFGGSRGFEPYPSNWLICQWQDANGSRYSSHITLRSTPCHIST